MLWSAGIGVLWALFAFSAIFICWALCGRRKGWNTTRCQTWMDGSHPASPWRVFTTCPAADVQEQTKIRSQTNGALLGRGLHDTHPVST